MSESVASSKQQISVPQSICTSPKRDRDLTGMECSDRFKINFEKRDWTSVKTNCFVL